MAATGALGFFWGVWAVCLLMTYWILGIAWFWIEDCKVDNDSDYQRA